MVMMGPTMRFLKDLPPQGPQRDRILNRLKISLGIVFIIAVILIILAILSQR